MAHLIGSSGRVNKPAPPATSLRIQTSIQGVPIPIGWGRNRLSGNLIWYGDFLSFNAKNASASGGGKGGAVGGGGKGSSTTVNYQAALIIGLCEGPISTVNQLWNGTTLQSLPSLNLVQFSGSYTQSAWGYLTSLHPSQAIPYHGLAYVASGPMQLGSSPSPPNLSFDISFTAAGTAISGSADVDPSYVLTDFLSNVNYGVGWQTEWIADLSVYTSYCRAAGLVVSPVLTSQTAASSFLSDLLTGTNSEAVWSQGQLKVVPYGDQALSANGSTYTPPDAPVYDFTDDDFVLEAGSNVPITITRTRAADAINDVKVEFLNGDLQFDPDSGLWINAFNPTPVEVQDEASVDAFGRVPSDTLTWHFFTATNAATTAASLYLGRQAIRNTYVYSVKHASGVLLEPMDITTLTEAATGLSRQWVRITDIQENSDLTYSITAQDYLAGTAHAPLYGQQANAGFVPNYDQDAGDINDPIIFEPPDALDPGLKVWAAVSGQNTAIWGGCEVWAAYNGSSAYAKIGEVVGPARMGVLAADLPAYAGENPDTTNTLSVDLTESAAELTTVSAEDADALNSLCYVDRELIGYEIATLTGTDAYDLTRLTRGAYGTGAANVLHDTGTKFVRLDGAIFKFAYDAARVGSTIQLKFLSFNVWGGGRQSLADVDAYTYLLSPFVPTLSAVTAACVQHATGIYLDWSVPTAPGIATLKVEISYGDPSFASPVLVSDGQELAGSFPLRFSGSPETVYVRAQAFNLGGVGGNVVANNFGTFKPVITASNATVDGGALTNATVALAKVDATFAGLITGPSSIPGSIAEAKAAGLAAAATASSAAATAQSAANTAQSAANTAQADVNAAQAELDNSVARLRDLTFSVSPNPDVRALIANQALAGLANTVSLLEQSAARQLEAFEQHRSQVIEAGLSPGSTGEYRISGVDVVGQQVNSVQINLNALSAQISLIASASGVDLSSALTTIASVSTRLDALSASLSSYVLTATFNPVSDHVTSLQTTMDGLSSTITTKASEADLTALTGRVTDVETVLDASGSLTQSVNTIAGITVGDALQEGRLDNLEGLLDTLRNGIIQQAAGATETLSGRIDANGNAIAGLSISLQAQTATSSAQITQEQQVRASADSAEATARSAISTQVNDASTGLPKTRSDLLSYETSNNTALTAATTRVTSLESTVNDGTTGLVATRSQIATYESTNNSAVAAVASRTTTLESTVNDASTGLVATRSQIASYEATNNTAVSAVASRTTALETTVNDGTSGVVATHSALTTYETTNNSAVSALASRATALESTVNNGSTGVAATASALASLTTTVTSQGTTLTSTASSLSSLSSQVNDAASGLPQTRSDLLNYESTNNTAVSAVASRTTTLESTVNDGTTGLVKTRSDLINYESTNNTAVTANATAISTIRAQLDNPTGNNTNLYSAVTAETSARVAGDNTNAAAITSLQSALAGYTGANAVSNAVAALNSSVSTAQTTANGKNQVFEQSTVPTAVTAGDLWIDTGHGNLLYRANAPGTGGWVQSDDARIASLVTTTNSQSNSITSLQNALNGYSGANAVANAVSGLSSSVSAAQSTANSRNTTFSQSTTPTALTAGDIWFDTGHGNLEYRATAPGTANWVPVDDARISANANAITTINSSLGSYSGSSAVANALNSLSTTVNSSSIGNSALSTAITAINSSLGSYTGSSAVANALNSLSATTSNPTSGNSALATALTTVQATANQATASGQVGFYAVSAPTGYSAAYQIKVMVSGTPTYTGMTLLIDSSGNSVIAFDAEQFLFRDTTNGLNPAPLLDITSGVATFNVPVSIRKQDIATDAVSSLLDLTTTFSSSNTGISGSISGSATIDGSADLIIWGMFDGSNATIGNNLGTTSFQINGSTFGGPKINNGYINGTVYLTLSTFVVVVPAGSLGSGSYAFKLLSSLSQIGGTTLSLVVFQRKR